MTHDKTWEEFCALYYDSAMTSARINLGKLRTRLGGWDARVDENYVLDTSVLSALEKTYANYDPLRGCKVTTYLANIVHNEVVDNMEREIKEASRKTPVSASVSCSTPEEVAAVLPQKVIDYLMSKLKQAVNLLSPSDQVILKFYLDDAKTYVERSVAMLGVSENCIRVRKSRIFGRLPDLMGVSVSEFREMYEPSSLAGSRKSAGMQVQTRYNVIWPELQPDLLAEKLYRIMSAHIK